MRAFLNILKDYPAYLWSGWSSLGSIFLFFALWDVGYQAYGDFVLPSPANVLSELYRLLQDQRVLHDLYVTAMRVFWGFGFSFVIGSLLGLLAGFFATASMLSRPYATIFMGTPPIAWIVLAMIWFGLGDNTVIFTVIVASFPIIFIGALQGTRTLEGDLKEVCDSFHLPFLMKFRELYIPHIFSYIFPAWISALGMSWKIVVMAELLSTNDGLGAALGVARSQLDTPVALALVSLLIGALMLVEYGLLEPIKREVEAWRD